MSNDLKIPTKFSNTLHKLQKLSRNHLLFFRLEVGKLMLGQFFDGDPAAYQSQDPAKPQSFNAFVSACSEDLADIGLSSGLLRQCIVAHLVVQALPAPTVAKLALTQVVELAKIEDAATRSVLAHATVENHWTTKELKGAVQAANAGKWIDADPKAQGLQAPGLQPPPIPHYDETHRPHAGRVVARLERILAEFEEAMAQWALVDIEKVSDEHKARVEKALAGLGKGK